MEPRDIYITEFDLARLKELVHVGIMFKEANREHPHLEALQHELDRAHIVEPTAIPSDVVTMNSRVRLKNLDPGQESELTLVFPSNADLEHHKISVLAPVGTAILGCRVGDSVDWPVPAGIRKMAIEEVLYQPEAAGRYDQ
ncbi:MAG TPA: nucleoside diphosphate kinase regulator [Nitrospira sp.]|nr:nucleoside diphosphate kinase regulator [Nitrospira sp.]